MAYFDSQWWDALETGVANLARAVRTTFEADPGNAALLRRLVSGDAEPAEPAESPPESPPVVPPVAAESNHVAKPAEPAAPLVDSVLKFGDNVPVTVRARDTGEPLPPPPPETMRGPRVVAEAEPEPAEQPMTLARLAADCGLKARATRWQGERSRRLDAGEDIRDLDMALIDEGRATDCWLWMIGPDRWQDRGPRAFALVSGCYDALGAAAALMKLSDDLNRDPEPALALLAEAQSGVRAMMAQESYTEYDADQDWVFRWLKEQTSERGVFLNRHMRLHDAAEPENYEELIGRIEAHEAKLSSLNKQRKQRDNLFGKINYALKKLAATKGEDQLAADHPQVTAIDKAVTGLLADGLPASDKKLRELLIPLVGRLPDAVGPELSRVLAEVDQHLDRQHAEAEAADDDGPEDELLAKARELTRGRHAILIGGQPEEEHRRRLERDLALESLRWLRVAHGESFEVSAGPALSGEHVTLAMVMTRWRSHRDGPAARSICRDRGIALVELPGGYGSRRVAHELLAQASDKLARDGDA